MSMQSLHLVQLVLTGCLVALLPLTFVWVSGDPDKYRKLVWVTLFFTFDLIIFGAFTRLTDSGLGCPDWPGCYGQANPLQAHAAIHAAQTLMPSGPVTLSKAWIEMIHRYLAGAIGILTVALMVLAWRGWLQSARLGRRDAKFSPWLPTGLFFLICLQIAFGAFTVTFKLQPIIVTTHLLLGMSLLALLSWLAARQTALRTCLPAEGIRMAGSALGQPTSLARLAAWAACFLTLQIALGGWVSTNYAALACSDFPLCQGAWLPPMDWAHAFSLWRDLGKTASGDYLPFPALTAIHWLHRSFALLVFAVAGWAAYRALAVPSLHRIARGILIVLGLQLVSGLATIFLAWPLLIAVAHNAGAASLVFLLTMLNYRTRNITPYSVDLAPCAHAATPT
jgi:cytochrome c oxidase assembly protein subunit 15